MSKKTDTVNIILKTSNEKEEVLKHASVYEKYLIVANETLQKENKEKDNTIHELENKISEIEEDNEKFDVSKRYTRGLLKNLVEIERKKSSIVVLYEKIENIYKKQFRLTQLILNVLFRIIDFISIVYFLFVVYYDPDPIFIIYFTTIFTLTCFTFENVILYTKIPYTSDIKKEIKDLQTDIDKTNASQDFIHDYIDMI